MKLENWADFHKFNKELLDDDFNHGQALVIKTKTAGDDKVSEVSTTYKQGTRDAAGDSKVAFEAKFKTAIGDTNHEAVIKQDGNATYEYKHALENSTKVKGLSFVANGSAWTHAGGKDPEFKVGLDYTSGNIRTKFSTSLNTFVTEGYLSYLNRNLALAANYKLNLKKQGFEQVDFGANWNPSGSAILGLRHESPAKNAFTLGKFFVFVNHAATVKQTVGSEFTLDWATRAVTARLGLLHKFNDESSSKFKVNEQGRIDATLKHKINSALTVTFATGFSLRGIIAEQKSKTLPIGLQFDVKI